MAEWLQDTFRSDGDLAWDMVALRLAAALALGCVVAGVYCWTNGKKPGQAPGLTATLVLLTVLIALVTLVIGNSVARAFSLVGALAIVRFRTVVEDTRDTAFVIFAVAVGMAVGAGYLLVPALGIPFATAAALLFRPRRRGQLPALLDYTLNIRIGIGLDPEALLREPFAKHLAQAQLSALTTARQGAAIDLTYSVQLRHAGGALALIADLNGRDGVQNVELRRG